MKILALGDICGRQTIEYLSTKLRHERERLGADFVVANGENATDIHGVTAADAKFLLDVGVDLITGGNHTLVKRDIYSLLDVSHDLLRPLNYPAVCPGMGSTIMQVCGWRVLCINVLGTTFLEPLESPFDAIDRLLERERGNYDLSLLDIHAEATSEKLALARYLDGRINIIFGTHTHVQTADEQILPHGTGYITDLGMSGPTDGVLGTDADTVIARFRTKLPQRFTLASGEIRVHGAIFEFDTGLMRTTGIRRVCF